MESYCCSLYSEEWESGSQVVSPLIYVLKNWEGGSKFVSPLIYVLKNPQDQNEVLYWQHRGKFFAVWDEISRKSLDTSKLFQNQ